MRLGGESDLMLLYHMWTGFLGMYALFHPQRLPISRYALVGTRARAPHGSSACTPHLISSFKPQFRLVIL